ncbi:MAG: hybrid sensor histidine kinase/response regulator [Gammaproteobacteria bacterium]|nr:hybrid sensor histidine kinase/response regulator [Gammaproteobacteria bacterium]
MSPSSGGLGDLSMFDLFRMEVESQVAILSEELLSLEDNASSDQKLEILMRAAHSLKGAARMVSIEPIVKISHVMEDVFVAAQQGGVLIASSDVDVLLAAVDAIVHISRIPEKELNVWGEENAAVYLPVVESLKDILSAAPKVHTADRVNSDLDVSPPPVTTPVVGMSVDNGQGTDERSLKIGAERMSRILGLSSEILVEAKRLSHFKDSLQSIKRKQDGLVSLLEGWQDLMLSNSMIDADAHNHALLQFDSCRRSLSEQINRLDEYDRTSINLTTKLFNEVAGSRMRPFEDAVVGLKRMVRDLARSLDKRVSLEINGGHCAVDRDVLEKIKSPINHLLRNSIDHGIENSEQRKTIGKPETATIKLTAVHSSGMLRISIGDDGAGIDVGRIKNKVLTKNLIGPEMMGSLSDEELLEFLFLPDFSTRDVISEISGRGVGLDVVRDSVKELGGVVTVNNRPGVGAEFVMTLPITLSVMPALLVDIADEPYAFPLSRVDRILKISTEDVLEMEGRQYVCIDNKNIGLVSGVQVLGFDSGRIDGGQLTVVIISDRLDQYGLVVDRYVDQRQLSVHALDQRLGKIPNVSSAALLGNGDPVLILDVDDVVRSINHIITGGRLGDVYQLAEEKLKTSRKRVLVVDDSLTVREVEKDLLEASGYLVDVAVDGMDGWNAIRRVAYDLIITDVDMPRMDGIELVKSIKQDLHLRNIPVMIVSYKDRVEERRRGLDAGADYYLTKGSFHDDTLVEAVEDLIGEANK